MTGLTVKINGVMFGDIIAAKIGRDMEDVAGHFELTIADQARLAAALVVQIGQPAANSPINAGEPITILIDDEPVLVGTIEVAAFTWEADAITCRIRGRDLTGDLVDCQPQPELPVEFRGVDLLHVATQVCARFGIPVTADIDVGAPFDLLVRHKHMSVLAFLESGSRQRSVLLTSNGIGGLVLTRSGTSRAPADLSIGDNVSRIEATFDWTKRFSDYYVTQDTMHAAHGTSGQLIDRVPDAVEPDDGPDAVAPTPATATGAMGHAVDPEITRFRPTVRLTRSQSGMSTLQEQAEWMARVAKGNATPVRLVVQSWRAGPDNVLWRPNQLAKVWDPYSGLDRDMLIAGVEFELSEAGPSTALRVVGPSAYDRINEADRKKHKAVKSQPSDLITKVPDA